MKAQHLIGTIALIIVQSCSAQAAPVSPSQELAQIKAQTREIRAKIKALREQGKEARALQALDKARAARDKAAADLMQAQDILKPGAKL